MSAGTHLAELAVTDLGIIESARLVLEPGLTAFTGETGAGKTLVIGAIDLLLGGRADPTMVRTGAKEAVVEGRFVLGDEELVLTRVLPANGRSRAYVNGRMATAGSLAETSQSIVDLHGQHDHQSLLSARVQRASLDLYGGVDLRPLQEAQAEQRRLRSELEALGGDRGAREREVDLLRYQLAELDAAALEDPDEDRQLDERENLLADAVAHREAAALAVQALSADAGAGDAVATALGAVDGRTPFAALASRLRDAQAELADIASELRAAGELVEEDPEALAQVRERRQLLVELRRKYGTAPGPDGEPGAGTLADVLAYHRAAQERLGRLERHDATAAELERQLAEAEATAARAAARVGAARRGAAAGLAQAVQEHLADLAMPNARLAVEVGEEDPGDQVQFLLAANPGSAPAPLAKVASGGELARTMLALRLVLSAAPPVLIFDEVDAGIGGEAALAVGRSLATLGQDHQVLVVTHLPQVAAFASHHITVTKRVEADRTRTELHPVGGEDRVIEVARMLAGTPDSARVRDAAVELLASARAATPGT